MMVEVFKTNVTCPDRAATLVRAIHARFEAYHANFDLSDCDRILRVASTTHPVCAESLIAWLHEKGIAAEVLPDVPDFAAYGYATLPGASSDLC